VFDPVTSLVLADLTLARHPFVELSGVFRIKFLDVGEAAGEFAELTLRGVDVEEVTAVGPFLDFRDLSTSAGEPDMVADLEVSHS